MPGVRESQGRLGVFIRNKVKDDFIGRTFLLRCQGPEPALRRFQSTSPKGHSDWWEGRGQRGLWSSLV